MPKSIYDFMLTTEKLNDAHIPVLTAMLEHDKLDGFSWVNEGYDNVEEFIRRVLICGDYKFYWVLRFGNAIVGFSGFRYDKVEGKYLTKTYISPVARGMGIADNITKTLSVLSEQLDIKLYSKVHVANKRSNIRLERIAGNGIPSKVSSDRVIYSLENSDDGGFSPVIFALSEKMLQDLERNGYVWKYYETL